MSTEISSTSTEVKYRKTDLDQPRQFKHWVRPRSALYSYLYDYHRNYYDDVLDYLDRRRRGIIREIPRPQTWAERALRTYTQRLGATENAIKARNDLDLIHRVRTSRVLHDFHSRDYNAKSAVSSASTGNINKTISFVPTFSNPNERGDAENQPLDSGEGETAVAETPAKTELFEIKGPNGTAFLIEVHEKDLEEVRRELVELKGEYFHFDKTIIEWFTMKCILVAESSLASGKDRQRLAKVHAISSGSEEVYEGTGKFFFVNSLDRTIRAKRILERFGYNISGILYRFQPREKVSLDDRIREVCYQFVGAVERLSKVISVTHNL